VEDEVVVDEEFCLCGLNGCLTVFVFSVVVACGWLVRDFDYLIAFKSVEIYRIHGLWLATAATMSIGLLSSGRAIFLGAWLWRVRRCYLMVVAASQWCVDCWRVRLVF
jgi:hypothetical protein